MVELELCWGTVPEASLVELIDLAAATEVPSISVRPAMYLDAVAEGRTDAELRRRLDDAGVRVGVVDPLVAGLPGVPPAGSVPPAFRRFAACTADDCWRAAEALGSTLVNVAQFLGPPAPPDALLDAIRGLAERAEAHGAALSVEFIPGTGIPDLTAARRIHEATDGAVGVMFDTWHFHRSGAALTELDELAGVVVGVQLNDAAGPPPGGGYVPMADRLLPGEGELPLVEVLGALRRGHPDVTVGIEVFSAELRARPPLDAARAAVTAARHVVDRL